MEPAGQKAEHTMDRVGLRVWIDLQELVVIWSFHRFVPGDGLAISFFSLEVFIIFNRRLPDSPSKDTANSLKRNRILLKIELLG